MADDDDASGAAREAPGNMLSTLISQVISLVSALFGGMFARSGSDETPAVTPVRKLTDSVAAFIESNGNTVANVTLSDTLSVDVQGDLGADGKTLTVKTLWAKKPDGSNYVPVTTVKEPFSVAIDEHGRIDAGDSRLRTVIAQLEDKVENALKREPRSVTMSPDGKEFTYEVSYSPTKTARATDYEVFHGTVGADGTATITDVTFQNADRQPTAAGRIDLHDRLTVPMENGRLLISFQEAHDLSRQGHQLERAANRDNDIERLAKEFQAGKYDHYEVGNHDPVGHTARLAPAKSSPSR